MKRYANILIDKDIKLNVHKNYFINLRKRENHFC